MIRWWESHHVRSVNALLLTATILISGCSVEEVATPTSTLEPPTATVAASPTDSPATETPLPATPTKTLQPSPTATPVPPTATPTQQLTPTALVGDPAQALGEPDWIETFDSADNWALMDTACFDTSIEGGVMVMTALSNKLCWLVTKPEIQNFYLEVTMDPSDCLYGGEFGLYFRGPESSSGYLFTLNCTVHYLMTAWDGQEGSKTTLIDEEIDPELAWPTRENRLGVLADGNRYRLYINGEFLVEVEDNTFTGPGLIGLAVQGGALNDILTVRYDNLAFWELPPSEVVTPSP